MISAGHTSFRYLREFSFDMIKIDGQFIRKITHQPDNQVLTAALQAIAHHFDMFTVAELVVKRQTKPPISSTWGSIAFRAIISVRRRSPRRGKRPKRLRGNGAPPSWGG